MTQVIAKTKFSSIMKRKSIKLKKKLIRRKRNINIKINTRTNTNNINNSNSLTAKTYNLIKPNHKSKSTKLLKHLHKLSKESKISLELAYFAAFVKTTLFILLRHFANIPFANCVSLNIFYILMSVQSVR